MSHHRFPAAQGADGGGGRGGVHLPATVSPVCLFADTSLLSTNALDPCPLASGLTPCCPFSVSLPRALSSALWTSPLHPLSTRLPSLFVSYLRSSFSVGTPTPLPAHPAPLPSAPPAAPLPRPPAPALGDLLLALLLLTNYRKMRFGLCWMAPLGSGVVWVSVSEPHASLKAPGAHGDL